jgi:serine/threonine protein kinase
MPIAPGTHIGPYEVTTQLGEGGMGVVFRARDTRLLRDVALKLLPEHFADDPERLARFQREAQVLASLNHPNIAQIYGFERVGNAGCIVMELVEGETLAERLKNGPLKPDEAVEIAKQIANALAAAHDRGIVHRDLKPANIKMTPKGTVKVLDFGLAKALVQSPADSELSQMPTKVSGSMAGTIVGTAGYMSPEQARGREVDARADIWAFGCVLYEMLTGRQAFGAETATDMLAKIVTGEADFTLLPAETPASIRLLLKATLNKNPQQRLQHIGDMNLFLDPKFFLSAETSSATAASSLQGSRPKLLVAALIVLLIAALIPAVMYLRSSSPNLPQMHFELGQTTTGIVFVSPDGQRLAYVAQPGEDNRAIWIRPIGSQTSQRLTGTDNANTAGISWSPDSRYLSFVADAKLKKVDVTGGGSVQVLGDLAGTVRGITWNREGVILFSKDGPGSAPNNNIILAVADTGGTARPIVTLDPDRKEVLHAMPAFLPDGKHFLYVTASSIPENAGIYLGSLDSKTRTRLLPLSSRVSGVAYAPPGYILLSGETLTAHRFDPGSLAIQGEPITIAEGIDGYFSVSDTGLLFYRRGSNAPPARNLIWYDRAGKRAGQVGGTANYGNVEISPDGNRVAVDINTGGNRDIWVIDIARAVPSRITFDPGADWTPSWSSDGKSLLFGSSRNGAGIYQKSSSGVGADEVVFDSDQTEIPIHWSPNGRYAVFSRPKRGANTSPYDTWIVDLMGEKKATPFIESPFDKIHARISPDGRWIAYATNDSGMYQIVVQSFPDPNGGKWQITAQGGLEPKWRRDGRELYYLALDGTLTAVPVKTDRTFEAGTPEPLFETELTINRNQPSRDRRYDVAADGRFLIVTTTGTTGPAPVTAVVNWTAGLAAK